MLVNMELLGAVAWVFVGTYIVFIAPPLLLIDAGVAFALSRVRGSTGQIGWGMLLGCLAVSLTIVLGVAVFLVGQAIGP